MTSMVSLDFQPLGSIKLAFNEVYLGAGVGTHRLEFKTSTYASWLPKDGSTSNTAVILTGEAWLNVPSYRWFAGFLPQVAIVRGFPTDVPLAIDLSDEQLIALDALRGAGDITLGLTVNATLLGSDPAIHPVASANYSFVIKGSRWLELLGQIGHEVGITLRVPSPLTDSADAQPPASTDETAISLTQAAKRLRTSPCLRSCHRRSKRLLLPPNTGAKNSVGQRFTTTSNVWHIWHTMMTIRQSNTVGAEPMLRPSWL